MVSECSNAWSSTWLCYGAATCCCVCLLYYYTSWPDPLVHVPCAYHCTKPHGEWERRVYATYHPNIDPVQSHEGCEWAGGYVPFILPLPYRWTNVLPEKRGRTQSVILSQGCRNIWGFERSLDDRDHTLCYVWFWRSHSQLQDIPYYINAELSNKQMAWVTTCNAPFTAGALLKSAMIDQCAMPQYR